MKNKKLLIAGTSLISVSALAIGAFAFFKDNIENSTSGKVGTVDINASLNIENEDNLNNINPGDNDPDVSIDNRKGTDHELKLDITNHGSKSVKTRNVIKIKVVPASDAKYENGSTIGTLGDSEYYPTGLLMPTNDKKLALVPAVVGLWVNSNESTEDIDANKDGIKENSTSFAKNRKLGYSFIPIVGTNILENGSLMYVTETTILSGNPSKTAPEIEVNGGGDEIPFSTNFSYDLSLSKDAGNVYQNAKIEITIEVQSIQYRNTDQEDWKTIFTDTVYYNVNS